MEQGPLLSSRESTMQRGLDRAVNTLAVLVLLWFSHQMQEAASHPAHHSLGKAVRLWWDDRRGERGNTVLQRQLTPSFMERE